MQTNRTTPSRSAKRADYTAETIYSILDDALFCTVSYVLDGQPTAFARNDDTLYIHGSVGSHFIRNDDPEDADLPTWSGVIPMATVRLTPVQHEGETIPLPDYLK